MTTNEENMEKVNDLKMKIYGLLSDENHDIRITLSALAIIYCELAALVVAETKDESNVDKFLKLIKFGLYRASQELELDI